VQAEEEDQDIDDHGNRHTERPEKQEEHTTHTKTDRHRDERERDWKGEVRN